MTLSAPVLHGGELHDTIARRPVLGSRLSLDGMVFDVRVDTVDFGAAGTLDREYVEHPGASLIVALLRSTESTTSA